MGDLGTTKKYEAADIDAHDYESFGQLSRRELAEELELLRAWDVAQADKKKWKKSLTPSF